MFLVQFFNSFFEWAYNDPIAFTYNHPLALKLINVKIINMEYLWAEGTNLILHLVFFAISL